MILPCERRKHYFVILQWILKITEFLVISNMLCYVMLSNMYSFLEGWHIEAKIAATFIGSILFIRYM